jgi:hypothetical protein
LLKFLILTLFIVILITIFLYFILKNRQQVIQAFTIQDFMNNNSHNVNDIDTNEQKTLIDTINDFFDDDNNEGNIDNGDNGDIDDGGE